MDSICHYNQIRDSLIVIKAYKEGFITNFFIDEERCNLLIKNNLLSIVNDEKCTFILHQDHDFYHIYFIATNNAELGESLKKLIQQFPEIIFVADIIGAPSLTEPLSSLFESVGFHKSVLLNRMSRIINPDQIQTLDPRVQYATLEQSGQLHDLLEENFDKYSEQLPLLEEIEAWVKDKKILVVVEQQKIAGFVIFEITGLRSYLRYWFTHPNRRNQKIGSALLRRFFHECRDTKRQLFWVINNNENAIAKYKHYGFEEEQMFDQTMVKTI
jgi:ribosomal protein S18 acetylase RimI-like enzyme